MKFLAQTAERAIKTAAQAALTSMGGNTINAWDLNLHAILGMSGGAAIASVLMSIVSYKFGPDDSPSLVDV